MDKTWDCIGRYLWEVWAIIIADQNVDVSCVCGVIDKFESGETDGFVSVNEFLNF